MMPTIHYCSGILQSGVLPLHSPQRRHGLKVLTSKAPLTLSQLTPPDAVGPISQLKGIPADKTHGSSVSLGAQ